MPEHDPAAAGPSPGSEIRSNPWRRSEAPELAVACVRHAPGAWEEFLRRYGNLIYSTLHRLGLDEEAREEGFQTSVIAIHRALPELRDAESLVSWIIRITYRQGVNQIRARTRARETPIEEMTEVALHRAANPVEDEPVPPDEIRLRLERAQMAEALMDAISERCKRLLALLFYEDPPLDYSEISQREGIPVGSIGPTRARCLERARRVAADRGFLD